MSPSTGEIRKTAARPVREYLAGLEQENASDTTPKAISLTDPAASWTAAPGGPAFYAYSTNYPIDLKAGIIVDVEASAVSSAAEAQATRTMLDRVEEKFGMTPQRLVGDTNYGSAAMLGWLVDEKHIEPHVPVWDKAQHQDGVFSRSDFEWNEQANEYRCPEDQGAALRLAPIQESTHAHHESRHHHLSIKRTRLRGVCAESPLLPEDAVSQDHPQHS